MSATPQDFSIWSKLTGNPYPRTPEERMALAPHVRQFVQNIGKQPVAPVERENGMVRAVKAIGKTALAAGVLMGGAVAAHQYLKGDSIEGGSTEEPSGAIQTNSAAGHRVADTMHDVHQNAEEILKGGKLAHPFSKQEASQEVQRVSVREIPKSGPARMTGTIMTNLPLLQPAQGPEAAESSTTAGTPPESLTQYEEAQEAPVSYPAPTHDPREAYQLARKALFAKAHPAQMAAIEATRESLAPSETATQQAVTQAPGMKLGEQTVPTQIRVRQAAKGAPPGSPARETIESGPETQAAKLATAQVPGARRTPSQQEVQELDQLLTRTHGSRLNVEQRVALRNQMPGGEQDIPTTAEYVGSGQTVTPSAQPQAAVDPKAFARGFGRVAATQQQEARIPTSMGRRQPAASDVPGQIQYHREEGRRPDVRAGSHYAFSPQDEESARLARIHHYGYDPHEHESPAWW